MRRILNSVMVLFLAMTATPALAGIYSDDLSKCLVKSSSENDQLIFVKAIFAAMALHPAIKDYATITNEERAKLDAQVSALVMRLVTADCRTETVAALKYEGPGVFELSFRVLGEVAMRGLTGDPAVSGGFAAWGRAIDKDKILQLYKDAGLQPPPQPAK